ncbi:MAG: hypothetical protein HQ575_04640, partial [Candidatus Omnitrophica bacterium]|nr:hypothetical protein [Candidatus Omnitrophota bacterium]
PYMVVVGEKEAGSDSVSVRSKSKGDLGVMKIEAFIEKIREEIRLRCAT